jgi:hypothetical protein
VSLTEVQRQALFHRPQPLVHPERGLAVLFSAKAGCTLALKWFFDQVGLLEAALSHSTWVHDYRLDVFYGADGYRPEALLEPGMRVIKFVRDPYERAVSSYIHALRAGYADAPIATFLGRSVAESQRYTFREFVGFLESDSLTAERCDPHHKRQVHQVERLGLVTPSHVIRVEEARDGVPRLERQLELKATSYDELRPSTHHTVRASRAAPCADRSDWPADGRRQRIEFPATHFFYDPPLLARVRALYLGDFEAYGYDPKRVPRAAASATRHGGDRFGWAQWLQRFRRR